MDLLEANTKKSETTDSFPWAPAPKELRSTRLHPDTEAQAILNPGWEGCFS